MENCCEILKIIVSFLSVVLEVGAIIFAIIEFVKYKKENNKARVLKLRQEIAAYYCMADLMAKDLATTNKSVKSVKTDYMDKAMNHPDNYARIRPSKSAKDMYN